MSTSTFNIDGFIEYLQSLAGGNKSYSVAKAIATDISTFFEQTSHSSTSKYYDILLDTNNLYKYISLLQNTKQFTASTISEKLRRLRQAIEYTEVTENSITIDQGLIGRCQRVIGQLVRWGKSLHKEISKQRQRQDVISQQQVRVAHNPNEFLQNPAIKTSVMKIISKAEYMDITSFEHLTVIAFLAAHIIFSNAQRPGVVQFMTVQEFNDRTETGDEQILINVKEHKTASAQGPANVVISSEVEAMMITYLSNVRVRVCTQQFNTRFFLTFTGKEFCKISEKIAYIAKHFNVETPTACLHRKVISTLGYEELDPKEYQSLNKHMSHSPHTAQKYYQFPETAAKAAAMQAHIVKLTKKQQFTEEEDELLLTAWPLTIVDTPSLAVCRDIIARNDMTKSAKQLQDHWRSLKKQSQNVSMEL